MTRSEDTGGYGGGVADRGRSRRDTQPIRNLLRRQRFAALSDAKREGAARRGARLQAVDASLSPPASERDSSPIPTPARAMGDVHAPHTARLCEICGLPLTGRRPQRVAVPHHLVAADCAPRVAAHSRHHLHAEFCMSGGNLPPRSLDLV